MPYINNEAREALSPILNELAETIKSIGSRKDRQGNLNYSISTLINLLYNLKYDELNSAIGVLECAKQELYRTRIASYEDEKIEENGDIVSMKRLENLDY